MGVLTPMNLRPLLTPAPALAVIGGVNAARMWTAHGKAAKIIIIILLLWAPVAWISSAVDLADIMSRNLFHSHTGHNTSTG